jgi:hypothetical protein
MYEFVDRPVTSLDHGGRFLVWSMRSWVKAMADRSCPAGAIAPVFAQRRMLPGLQPFLRMMALFNRHGLENFQFCALRCAHVSEHEAIFVSLLCGLRDSRPDAVRDTLTFLVEEEAIGETLASLTALGRAMDVAAIYPARSARSTGAIPPPQGGASVPRADNDRP